MMILKKTKKFKRKIKKQTKRLRNHFIKVIADEVEKRLPKEQFGFFDDRFYDDKEDNEPGIAGKQDEIEKTDEIMDLPLTGMDIPLNMIDSLLEDGVSEEKIETDPSEITIVEINYKRSPELERRYSRRYEIMDVPEEAEVALSYDDIAAKAPLKIKFMNQKCKLHFKEGSKTAVLVEPYEGTKKLTVLLERPNVHLKFIDDSDIIPCKIIAILDEKHEALFEQFDFIYRKISHVQSFSKLTSSQQQFVFETFNKRNAERKMKDDRFEPITNRLALKSSFDICKEGLPVKTREKLSDLFEEFESTHEAKMKEDTMLQIAYALNIKTDGSVHKKRTYEEIIDIFHRHVYGMDELIENIIDYILSYQYTNAKHGFAILLVGSPGVGKTSVCEAIAEVLCPLVNCDCAGANYVAMNGAVKNYTAASPGRLARSLFEAGTTDVIMRLDELDKLVSDKDGDAFSALLKPLGPQKVLHDEFLDFDLDVSATKFIATANDITKIPKYILNRFSNSIFYIPDYTAEDKAQIAEHHIVPKLLDQFGIDASELSFTPDALEFVAQKYCSDYGAREMEGNLQSLIRKVIKHWTLSTATKPLTVDKEFVAANLKGNKSAGKQRGIGFISS